MAALYGRAALGAIPGASRLPFVGGGGSELPDARARAGRRGGRPRRASPTTTGSAASPCARRCPPTYPHVLAFPLQMRLMADGGFPFPLIGLVHLDNSITQHRPIGAGEPLDLTRPRRGPAAPTRRAGRSRWSPRRESDGELVWEETGTILRRGGGDPEAPRDPRARPRPRGRARRHRVEARRRPRPPLRRRLRRPQPDPHARAEREGPRLPARDRPRDVEPGPLPGADREPDPRGVQRPTRAYGKPLLLPAKVSFVLDERDGGRVGFALRDARKEGIEHLLGDLTPES